MSKMHKNVCMALNYAEEQLISVSAVSGCISISNFTSLVDIPMDIASSAVRLKTQTITAGIGKYNTIIKEKLKKAT